MTRKILQKTGFSALLLAGAMALCVSTSDAQDESGFQIDLGGAQSQEQLDAQANTNVEGEQTAQNLVNSINSNTTSNNNDVDEDLENESDDAQTRRRGIRFREDYRQRSIWEDVDMPQRVFNNIPEGF